MRGSHIVAVSFCVYLFVNIFENVIHYNIGRFSNEETQLELPGASDFVKIVIVMCAFALLQGVLTNYLEKYVE
jgi:hypothetical protein